MFARFAVEVLGCAVVENSCDRCIYVDCECVRCAWGTEVACWSANRLTALRHGVRASAEKVVGDRTNGLHAWHASL